MKYLRALLCLIAASVSFLGEGSAVAAEQAAQTKVVFQVSDNEPAKWNLTLNNIKNMQTALGTAHVDIRVVAYGPGIYMLKFDSPVGNDLSDLIKSGVIVSACENTMHAYKLSQNDMLAGISYVPAGIVEIVRLQQQGYAYIKP